jgi:hypothetical protein
MDTIFDERRAGLLQRFEVLQQEQNKLEALTRARVLDETALMAAIDHVTQARGEVEKANTKMLMQIRAQMSPDQIERLDSHR